MKGWLERVTSSDWAGLRSLRCDEWLWIDTRGDGVHVAPDLPQEPGDITHVWGWGSQWAVRARLDPDLPHPDGRLGVAGAVLRWGAGRPAGETEVDVAESDRPVWPVANGRANLAHVPELHDRGAQLRTLSCAVDSAGPEHTVIHTVMFVRRP